MSSIRTQTVVIADGASLSGASVDLLTAGRLIGVITPSGWDTAKLTFAASVDGANFFPLLFEGTEVGAATDVAASMFNAVDPQHFAGVPFVKVRSGTAGTATNQSGAVTLTLVTWQYE